MILNGRHALVIGGGSGIGLATAQILAAAGAEVTITGRRKAISEVAAASHPGLFPAEADVTDEAGPEAAIGQAVAARGPLEICVANAGIAGGPALHKTDLARWRTTTATNLDGAFLTIRAALHSMCRRPWGRVIAIASIAGLRGPKGAPAYSASKHRMIGLLRGLAADYAGSGLTFNAFCPGYVHTDIVTRNSRAIAAWARIPETEAMAIMTGTNSHGRLVRPEEVAAAALWLCGPGSESVNGHAIKISGGQA